MEALTLLMFLPSTNNQMRLATNTYFLIRSTPESKSSRLLTAAEALAVLGQLLLIEGQAERLRGTAQSGRLSGRLLLHRIGRSALLHLLLASNALAPGRQHHVAVQRLHELLPGAHGADVAVALFARLVQQRALDGLQLPLSLHTHTYHVLRGGRQVTPGDSALSRGGEVITAGEDYLLLLEVLGSDLDAEGNALLLPVVELPAGVVVLAVVQLHADAGSLQLVANLGGLG